MGRAQNRKSGYGSIYAGPEYGGYSAYLKNRGRSSQMSLGEAVRNVVRIGSKLVARYEAKSCTTAEKAKKQKGGASAGVLVGSAVGDLLWNSGKAAVVSGAVRASGSAHVIVGGVVAVTVWWMNPIEAGESEEDVEKAQKKWEEAEKSKGESGAKTKEKSKDSGKTEEKTKPSNKPYKNNKEANKQAQKHGYKDAHELKEDYVGKSNTSKYDMKYDTKTGEIYLENKDGTIQVPTGLYNK